jgi:hypothetical protein
MLEPLVGKVKSSRLFLDMVFVREILLAWPSLKPSPPPPNTLV